jgi:hypothetical protein
MRCSILTLALLTAAVPLAAQQHGGHHHGGHQHGEGPHHAGHHQPGVIPDGWRVRLDRAAATVDQVTFMSHDGYVHLVLGPSGIFYRPDHSASGEYTAAATFTQNRAPHHPESYGLFVGGRDLEGGAQDYLYFLVRGDGRYLVKHRGGAETHTLIDWTEHPAVRPADAEGKATNALAVQAGDFGVRFLVNGTEVGQLPRSPHLTTDGVVGLRVNHNLDVKMRDFAITPGTR